jgi:hypothetical protein
MLATFEKAVFELRGSGTAEAPQKVGLDPEVQSGNLLEWI